MMAKRGASDRVIAAVAEREGASPIELDEPLYSAVDPDALDALVFSESENLEVSFTYLGYDITVTGGGDVYVNDEAA